MHMETTAGNIRSAMNLLRGVVERRNTIPILGCVKIGDGKVTGTNLDVSAEISLPTIGGMEGEAAIDFATLSALSRYIEADEILTMEDADHKAAITFNGSEYGVPSLPASDFPDFAKVEGARSLTGNAGIIAAMKRIAFAVSTEDTRYYLNGVAFVENPEGAIMLCATDGRRLAFLPIPAAPDGCKGQIVPRGLVSYLSARKHEPKAMVFDPNMPRVAFEFDGLTVSAKLTDGTYPDIWKVIPKDTSPRLSFSREPMLRVLRRIMAVTGCNDARGIKLTASSDKMVLSSKSAEGHTAFETLACTVPGEPFETGYNARYLYEMLSAFRGDTVTLSASEEPAGYPALFTVEGDDLRCVLMPMRV